MDISDEAMDRFIEIYERTYKEKISRDDAYQMARGLIEMYRLFLKRPPLMSDEEFNSLGLVEKDEEQ